MTFVITSLLVLSLLFSFIVSVSAQTVSLAPTKTDEKETNEIQKKISDLKARLDTPAFRWW